MASDLSLADSSNLKALPSKFISVLDDFTGALTLDSLPRVDFSALISDDHDQRSKAVQDLDRICQEWGFFVLVNHGIPERLTSEMLSALKDFFSLPASERKQYQPKSALDPITTGNKVIHNPQETFTLCREYLKLHVHPQFHCPHQPQILREVVKDYSERVGELFRKLIAAVSDGLELDRDYENEALGLDSSFQLFVGNYYPPCPQPDKAVGLMPHNCTKIQIEHGGQWYNVHFPPNSIFVNVDDHLQQYPPWPHFIRQIFTNGKYKSLRHRAVVNKNRERLSIAMLNSPSRETIVGPAAPMVEKDGLAMYNSMKFKEYMESRLKNMTSYRGKSFLEEQMLFQ